MKLLRFILSVVSVLLLGGGYLASQFMALQGRGSEYAQKVDQSSIIQLSLLLLVAAILLAFVPDRGEEPEP
ncbi:MAG: hypothetical protein ACOYON_01265 [Fimbriimonas sp.]